MTSNLSFESLKKLNEYGIEYWSARDLQLCLGYSKWHEFEPAIKKAKESCRQSGNDPQNHITSACKMVEVGSHTRREVNDYHLSRFACYLIAQNGDPRKPEIAQAQKYFAVQTRKQELSEGNAADLERLELRKQASVEFKALSGAARDAGVQNKMFGIFHDAGYKGLYGGLGVDAIKARKGIDPKEQLMDRMNTTELAANQFRMTHTREKLKLEKIKNQRDAMETHEMVGREVRAAIAKIGVAMPENISPAEPIKNVEKRLKKTKPQVILDEKHSGLLPANSLKSLES
ncbi:MAG: DNA damage-inducible protein D [Chlamydiae bacterium]|nr:DNA damage-inducible protein D [Chlamydiota bacterium]